MGRGLAKPYGGNIDQAVLGENAGEMNFGAKRRQDTQSHHKCNERFGGGWAAGERGYW